MQDFVFLTCFFKSYRRKTFGEWARPPPPLVRRVKTSSICWPSNEPLGKQDCIRNKRIPE